MIKNSKIIAGVTYVLMKQTAKEVTVIGNRVEVMHKDKSQTNAVSYNDSVSYVEYMLQTCTATEDEAHAVVSMLTAVGTLANRNGYPDFTSRLDSYGAYGRKHETALLSLRTLLLAENLDPNKNYLIIKREKNANCTH